MLGVLSEFTEKAAELCFRPFSKGRYMTQKRDYFTATLTKYLGVVSEALWGAVSFFVENKNLLFDHHVVHEIIYTPHKGDVTVGRTILG